MIAKTRAEFPLKVSTKRFTQNYCFQESGWLHFPVAHQIIYIYIYKNLTFKTFNVLFKIYGEKKIHNAFKITNISLLFRSIISVLSVTGKRSKATTTYFLDEQSTI